MARKFTCQENDPNSIWDFFAKGSCKTLPPPRNPKESEFSCQIVVAKNIEEPAVQHAPGFLCWRNHRWSSPKIWGPRLAALEIASSRPQWLLVLTPPNLSTGKGSNLVWKLMIFKESVIEDFKLRFSATCKVIFFNTALSLSKGRWAKGHRWYVCYVYIYIFIFIFIFI